MSIIVINHIIWDHVNVPHIAHHDITPKEVEQACSGRFITLATYSRRILLIGATHESKVIAVVLAPKGADSWYPVTARPASRKERKLYQSPATTEAA